MVGRKSGRAQRAMWARKRVAKRLSNFFIYIRCTYFEILRFIVVLEEAVNGPDAMVLIAYFHVFGSGGPWESRDFLSASR
jgi:hypothetical protein